MSNVIDAQGIATDDARRKVKAYVEEITQGAEVEGDITFELTRFGIGQTGSLGEVDFSFGQNIAEIVDEIVDIADTEARELIGAGKQKVKFTLRAIRNGKPIVRRETFALEIPQTGEDEEEDFLEELPTAKGALALTMRHQEKVIRATIGPQQKMMEALQRDNRELREQNAALLRASMEQWKMFQELVDAKHARDLEIRRFENDERRRDQVGNMLIQGAPVLLNKLLAGGGAPIVPETATPTEQLIGGLLSTIRPDQFQNLMQTGQIEFDVMQRATLAEIAMKFVEKEETRGRGDEGTSEKKTEVNGVGGHKPS